MSIPQVSKHDYDQVSRELVRALRGKRSQAQLNRKLRYQVNQLYRWESGYRSISWSDFSKLAEACGVPLKKLMREELGYIGDTKNASLLLKQLIGLLSVSEFARSSGLSRSALSRWLSGTGAPPLSAILRIMDREHCVLLDFIGKIVDIGQINALNTESAIKQRQKELQYAYPEIAMVICILDLDAYKKSPAHEPGMLARIMGVTLEHEKMLLQKSLEVGLIRLNGKHYELHNAYLDTRGNLQGTIRLRRYWMERALQALEGIDSITEPHQFTHLVFSCSAEAAERIREASYEFGNAVKTILSADEGTKTFVRCINIQNLAVVKR